MASTSSNSRLTCLPTEVCLRILKFCIDAGIQNVSFVSKDWRLLYQRALTISTTLVWMSAKDFSLLDGLPIRRFGHVCSRIDDNTNHDIPAFATESTSPIVRMEILSDCQDKPTTKPPTDTLIVHNDDLDFIAAMFQAETVKRDSCLDHFHPTWVTQEKKKIVFTSATLDKVINHLHRGDMSGDNASEFLWHMISQIPNVQPKDLHRAIIASVRLTDKLPLRSQDPDDGCDCGDLPILCSLRGDGEQEQFPHLTHLRCLVDFYISSLRCANEMMKEHGPREYEEVEEIIMKHMREQFPNVPGFMQDEVVRELGAELIDAVLDYHRLPAEQEDQELEIELRLNQS